jgi:Ca2+-binding RTX toxin-like protein
MTTLSATATSLLNLHYTILGSQPTLAQLNTYAGEYNKARAAGATADAAMDAIASHILESDAAVNTLMPNLSSPSALATAVLANVGVTNAAIVEFISKALDGSLFGFAFPLNQAVRVISDYVANYKTGMAADASWDADLVAAQAVVAARPVPQAVGQSFTLTAGLDVRTGGGGNDNFDGSLVNNNQLATLNSGDVLDGGAGKDSLFAVLIGGSVSASLTSIEALTIVNTNTGGTTIVDLAASTGIESINSQGSASAMSITGIASTSSVSLANTSANTTLGFAGVSGSADARTVTLSNVTGPAVISAVGVETVTVNAASGTNSITLDNANTATEATKLVFTGSGGLTLAAHPAATMDGSAATGSLILNGDGGAQTVTGGSGADTINGGGGADVIKGGAGNDRIDFANAASLGAATVDGGDGTDTINLTAVAGDAVVDSDFVTTRLSNIEGLRATDADGAFSITLAGNANTLGIVTVTAVDVAAGVNTNTVDLTSAQYTKGATVSTGTAVDTVSINMTTGGAHKINTARSATPDTDMDRINVTSGAASVRVTIDETAVGNGSVNNTDATPALAVVLQQQDATLVLSGVEVRTDDEGVDFRGAVFNVNTGSSVGTFNQVVLGTPGDDTVTPTLTNIYVAGGSGADNITGGAGNDYISGGEGNDTLSGAGGNDTVMGGAGSDTITVSTGVVKVSGGDGNDIVTVTGLGSTDVVAGDAGTDTLNITANIDAAAIIGVSGFERIGLGAATIDLDIAQLGTANSIEAVVIANASAHTVRNAGASFANLLVDTTGGSVTFSRLLNTAADTLNVAAATTGNKTVTLTLSSSGTTVTGEDTLNIAQGEMTNANDLVVNLAAAGARDLDTINVSGAQANTTIAIANANAFDNGSASRNVTVNGSSLTGSGTFTFTGTAATLAALNVTGSGNQRNALTGGTGADTLTGGNLDDTLTGGLGADVITGGVGNDTYITGVLGDNTELDGGPTGLGIDGMVINLGATALTAAAISTAANGSVLAALGTPVATGTAAYLFDSGTNSTQASDVRDTLASIENVTATGGKDYIVGSSGANVINGLGGNDTINGGAGNDTIDGGAGADSLNGGAGSDTYIVDSTSAVDTIASAGFTAGTGGDVLDFSALDAVVPLASGSGIVVNSYGGFLPSAFSVLVLTNDAVGNAAALKTLLDANANWDGTSLYSSRVIVWEIDGTTVGYGYVSDGAGADDVAVTTVGTISGFANQTAVSAFTDALVVGNFTGY